ncbi:MAG: type VI secretion system tube protein Hcp [Bacteroidia bacterium]|nr:type VI secretion system tube protein Hcp [Bacteroidia bacterium]
MKNIKLLIALTGLSFAILSASAQTTYEMYMFISDAGGPIRGPISSIPGVASVNGFFQLGCTEHQMEWPAGTSPGGPASGRATQNPFLLTRDFDPGSSPYIRQQLHTLNRFTVDIYYVANNGSTRTTVFNTRLGNAYLVRLTTAADNNGLQETLGFLYDTISWNDIVNGTSRGWDVVNNMSL